mgnify:CR=1 FL=1
MKKLLIIFIFSFLSFDFASAVSDLPPCKGKNYKEYVNCYGSYKNKDLTESMTSNYIGEFGVLPGQAHGKGIQDLYLNGDLIEIAIGNFKNDKLNGLATLLNEDLSYVGEWKDGQKGKNGTDFYINRKIVYVGQLENGLYRGLGTSMASKGWLYEEFVNDNFDENLSAIEKINHSPCKGTDLPQDRSLWRDCTVHEESFIDNNTDGSISTKYTQTGYYGFNEAFEVYSGEVRRHQSKWLSVYEDYQERPKFEGKGIVETYFDGKLNLIYIGEFEKGLRSGYGTEYDVVYNTVYVGQFKNNRFNGHGTYLHKDEQYVGNFRNGKYHGLGVLFRKDKRNISAFEFGTSLYEIEHNVKIDKDVALSCEKKTSYGYDRFKLILDKNLNRFTISSINPNSNLHVEEILLNSNDYLIGFYRDDALDKNYQYMLDKFNGEYRATELNDINDKYVIKPAGSRSVGYKCQNKLY